MRDVLLLLVVSGLFLACGTQKKVVQQEKQDTRIETRYERIFVHDTAYIEIPVQTAERTVKDSVSHLENDYSISEARINVDGSLFHSLQTKAQKKAVPVDKVVERKDSVIVVEKEVKTPVPVEKELTWWQRVKVDYFGWLLGVLAALVAYTFRKPLLTLIRWLI